jgi:hypothetical protein
MATGSVDTRSWCWMTGNRWTQSDKGPVPKRNWMATTTNQKLPI